MKIDKLKLLAGDPIKFYDIGKIYPFTIGDIKKIGGEDEFNTYLKILTISKDTFTSLQSQGIVDDDQTKALNKITNLDIIYILCTNNNDFYNKYIEAMGFIFRDKAHFTDYGICIGELNKDKLIDSVKYDEFIEVIKVQNCLKKQDDVDDENPANDKAKELLEKRKKSREKVNQIKNKDEQGNGEPLALDDLVSILCANGNGINMFNVWDLSFYAFNDQFNRMKMFEDFQINIHSLLAGADPNEIELKHWMSKID